MNLNGHLRQHEDVAVHVPVSHDETVAARRSPLHPVVAQPPGKLERDHAAIILTRAARRCSITSQAGSTGGVAA